MKNIYLRDAGVIDEKTNRKYFRTKEFFKRLDNAIYLSKKNSIGLQLTISKDFFISNHEKFKKKLDELKSLKSITIHLHAFYESLISKKKETLIFIDTLNDFLRSFENIKGFCIHPDNVSNYLFLKKLKIKKRYIAIEVCDLKSRSGNNIKEIRKILRDNNFLDLVLDSSHIEQIREKYPKELTTQQYFNEFKKKTVEIQISSNKNEYKKSIFTKDFSTDHCLLTLSDKKIYKDLLKIEGLKKINLVIEGVVPFNRYGYSLLRNEIKLLKNLK
jgi:hypothetical protein